MNLHVTIPYAINKRLGDACNETMRRMGPDDWVLFLDHDVTLLNPHWYEICMNAIEKYGKTAGWITCRTNRIACATQKYLAAKDTDDLNYHFGLAMELHKKCAGQVMDITDDARPLSGFFLLTKKFAWERVGGFQPVFLGMDTRYFGMLKAAGFRFYMMMDLYVYHAYKRWWKYGQFDGAEK